MVQTKYGDIEFGFAKNVAPKTVEHITKLVQLGAYNSNHFFRVRLIMFGIYILSCLLKGHYSEDILDRLIEALLHK